MKIYFCGSVTGGRDDVGVYQILIEHLKNHGEVLTEHLADSSIFGEGAQLGDKVVHDRDMDWLGEADVLIAEVTKTSLGVGYEIGRIVERNLAGNSGKRILILFRDDGSRRLSAMIAGAPGVEVFRYREIEEALGKVDEFFGKAENEKH